MSGKPSSSPFLWGDGQKKEHRQWTGPKQRQQRADEVPEERGREEPGNESEDKEQSSRERLLAQ
jgi:hypothetical protein